jgi:1,4-dihydroxy-2-naphthoyl-CoA hydrolase
MTPTETVQSTMPLCATLGITASEFMPDRVVLHLDWQAALCTSAGLLHGGALMALADSAGAASAFLNLPEGASGTSTIESKTNFLGAVREGASITATATPLHRGATTIVVETELRTADGKLVAKTTQTQAVLRPRV